MLTSDKPTLLDRWTAKDEAEIRDAKARIAEAEARRAAAVTRVRQTMLRWLEEAPTDEEVEKYIMRADEIRDALAPFDSGVRVAGVTA